MIVCTQCGKTWEDMESCVEDDALDHESFDRIDDDDDLDEYRIVCCKCSDKPCSWQNRE